jgi:hypothetical protein
MFKEKFPKKSIKLAYFPNLATIFFMQGSFISNLENRSIKNYFPAACV